MNTYSSCYLLKFPACSEIEKSLRMVLLEEKSKPHPFTLKRLAENLEERAFRSEKGLLESVQWHIKQLQIPDKNHEKIITALGNLFTVQADPQPEKRSSKRFS